MAKIVKIKGKNLQARIYAHDEHGRQKSIWRSLGTKDRAVAEERLLEVEKVEHLLKSGKPVDFWWMTGQDTQVRYRTLQDSIKQYRKYMKQERLSPKTREIYTTALKYLKKVIGKNYRIERVSEKEIDKLKAFFPESRSPHTVNKNLRAVRTFLNWAFERGYIERVPRIKMIRTPRPRPVYVTEAEFKSIIAHTSSFMAKVFQMYLETGMRLSAPFVGQIRGFFLEITGSAGKNGISQEIPLTQEHIDLIMQMQQLSWQPKHYSRSFWLACKEAGVKGKKFHSLRHSFALMTWIRTGDLYLTAKLLGHTSVSTTQIYTQFLPSKLEADFPSLAKHTRRIIPFRQAIGT